MPDLCVSETCWIQWGQLIALLTTPGYPIAAEDACCPGGRSAEAVMPRSLAPVVSPLPSGRAHRAYDSPIAQLNGLIQDYSEFNYLPISSFSNFDQQINPGSTTFFFPIVGPTDFNSKFRHTIHYHGKKYFKILNPINFIIIF